MYELWDTDNFVRQAGWWIFRCKLIIFCGQMNHGRPSSSQSYQQVSGVTVFAKYNLNMKNFILNESWQSREGASFLWDALITIGMCLISCSRPSTTSQLPLPRCPGFCLINIMAAFCERPSVLIAHTSNCQRGSVCCDNTRGAASGVSPPRPRPRPNPPATTSTTTTTTPAPLDHRPDCPGSCIVPYLSFTCFSK
jgi:hypothetical protein